MLRLVVMAVLAATLIGVAYGDTARVEILPFTSKTLKDSEFLAGGQGGQAVTIAGELRLPKSASAKLPAVILLHGSGGLGGTGSPVDAWSKELNELGVAVFAVDSFSGRGIVSTVADQAQFGRLNMVVDAYRALEVLAKHARIDPNRIAVMGFSRGGQSALYSAMTRLYQAKGPANNLRFAAHIAVYPDCMTTYRGDTEVNSVPIRILHGTADNYNPVAPCRTYVERLLTAKRDVKLIEFPDAHHVFDAPALTSAVTLTSATTNRRCRLIEGDDSQILNSETRAPFSYSDSCVEKGPTIAFNEAAYTQAHAFVREFLKALFSLS
ncbi:MAG: dienelactone hydrolase family protein [Rhodomicrobium sp.]